MSANDRQIGGGHYVASIQHWDLIEDYEIGYLEGNATKYVTRWRKKNGLQDLEKAAHYVEKLLEKTRTNLVRSGQVRGPRGLAPQGAVRTFAEANGLGPTEEAIVRILCGRWSPAGLELALQHINELKQEVTTP